MSMIALRWRMRQWSRTLGWQGFTGLALAALAAAVYLTAIEPGRAQVRQLEQDALSVRAFSRATADAAKAPGYEAWLEQFYRLLPAKASAPDWLRVIFSAAQAQSLGLEQGDYRVTLDRNGRLLAYEISLPVRGSYVQVRKFVADVLDRIPAIALDEISIKREAIGDTRIDAAIRFTLFLNAF